METPDTVPENQLAGLGRGDAPPSTPGFLNNRFLSALYALAIALSISIWFIAIRAPLWVDETISYFLIKNGFSQIMSRQGWPAVPAYYYILCLCSKVLRTSEVALRIPSVLAMLAAAYLLYLVARELFNQDLALIAAVVFCVHPIVVFASTDARPYAFAALAINASILVLVRLRNNNSILLAALFGFLAACIIYFQVLFQVILPALAVCFIAIKFGDRKALWRQGLIALAVFALAYLPVIPSVLYLLHTTGSHVVAEPVHSLDLFLTLVPGWLGYIFAGAVVIAAATRRLDLHRRFDAQRFVVCASLALVPILILFGVSAETSVHIFLVRYRMVAIPGIALLWAWLASRVDSRALRLLFCVVVAASVAYTYFTLPFSRHHSYTWKYALEVVEKTASPDNAPVLICSDIVESDHLPIPVGAAVKDTGLFAPLTYYKLSVPVVGLPQGLNDEAIRIASSFLQDAAQRRQRFLAAGFKPSYPTLHWLQDNAAPTYDVRILGTFDGVAVLEFTPRSQPATPR